jgi:hypothetical protein
MKEIGRPPGRRRLTTMSLDNIEKQSESVEQDPCYADFLREEAAFERLLPELLKAMPGRYVAVLDGKVIDQDKNEIALAERVIVDNPERFVLIRQVSSEPCVEYFDSPEVELR